VGNQSDYPPDHISPGSETKKGGKDGCARGCLIIAALGVAIVLVVCGAVVFLCATIIDRFTSPRPINVEVATPSSGEFGIAELELNRLRTALANNREDTIEFSAADLNALLAQDIDFAAARGKVRFGIADSAMTLVFSAPLDSTTLPGFKRRWFNGKLRFTADYQYEQFTFGPIFVESAGWRVPDWLLTEDFTSSFNWRFTKSFHDTVRRKAKDAAFWSHIKRITLEGDKLIVTTQHI
jgi:hypothetical protein